MRIQYIYPVIKIFVTLIIFTININFYGLPNSGFSLSPAHIKRCLSNAEHMDRVNAVDMEGIIGRLCSNAVLVICIYFA